jgi:cytidylate kinase
MYRAATWLVIRANVNAQDLEAVVKLIAGCQLELRPGDEHSGGRARVFANSEEITDEIRSLAVTRLVSPVSAIPGVRGCLVAQQQKLAAAGGVVMDGRDIGTVVLPNADLKIFLNASPEVRAARRLKELEQLGEVANLEVVLQDIKDRDSQDCSRAVAPLRQAQDAIAINSDTLTIDEVVERILGLCRRQLE